MSSPIVALTIAGSDSGGGAGVQGDLHTFAAHHVWGTTVITAITAQNTAGVHSNHALDPETIGAQLDAVLDDFEVAAAKTGMLGTAAAVEVVAARLDGRRVPLVIDPVLVSSSGAMLLDEGGRRVLLDRLVPAAAVITPNLPELEALTGRADRSRGAEALLERGCSAVVVTGGHHAGDPEDVLFRRDAPPRSWASPRLVSPSTHGTGCAFSAAIAARLASGDTLDDAVGGAHRFVHEAIRTARPIGAAAQRGEGAGPLNLLDSGDPTR